MAGTIALQNTAGWTQYINTKATLAKEKIPVTQDIEAEDLKNGKHVVLPFFWSPSVTIILPALESDGTTATNQTFKFLNAYRLPVKVTYSGTATA